MAWNMLAVKAPASSIKVSLDDIAEDVKTGVEEAYTYCKEHPAERVLIPFESDAALEEARAHIRSYAEARPDGKLTVSMWSGYSGTVDVEGSGPVVKWSGVATDTCVTPTLSLFVRLYVKKAQAQATPEPAATA